MNNQTAMCLGTSGIIFLLTAFSGLYAYLLWTKPQFLQKNMRLTKFLSIWPLSDEQLDSALRMRYLMQFLAWLALSIVVVIVWFVMLFNGDL